MKTAEKLRSEIETRVRVLADEIIVKIQEKMLATLTYCISIKPDELGKDEVRKEVLKNLRLAGYTVKIEGGGRGENDYYTINLNEK